MPQDHYFGHGRVAYVQIPAADPRASAAFYQQVFGWSVRDNDRPDQVSFTDATGDMIGSWTTTKAPSADGVGVTLHIYVHGLDATLARLVAEGAEIVKEPYPEGDLWVATFRDPAGNVVGIWQRAPR